MSCTILVVDDSAFVRRQLRATLASAGFDVVEAATAHEATGKLSGADIALAILDVNMPEMGGLAFLRSLRAAERWKELPALVLTAESDPALINIARDLHATPWLVKPFDPKKLVELATRLTQAAA